VFCGDTLRLSGGVIFHNGMLTVFKGAISVMVCLSAEEKQEVPWNEVEVRCVSDGPDGPRQRLC